MININTKNFKINYIIINFVAIFLCIYVMVFPFISKFLTSISPSITRCAYKTITGISCPLCGGTRYIAGIFNVFSDISYLFCPFGFIVMFIIFEVCFRIFCFIKICIKSNIRNIVVFDVLIHLSAFILFIAYEIFFFVTST